MRRHNSAFVAVLQPHEFAVQDRALETAQSELQFDHELRAGAVAEHGARVVVGVAKERQQVPHTVRFREHDVGVAVQQPHVVAHQARRERTGESVLLVRPGPQPLAGPGRVRAFREVLCQRRIDHAPRGGLSQLDLDRPLLRSIRTLGLALGLGPFSLARLRYVAPSVAFFRPLARLRHFPQSKAPACLLACLLAAAAAAAIHKITANVLRTTSSYLCRNSYLARSTMLCCTLAPTCAQGGRGAFTATCLTAVAGRAGSRTT